MALTENATAALGTEDEEIGVRAAEMGEWVHQAIYEGLSSRPTMTLATVEWQEAEKVGCSSLECSCFFSSVLKLVVSGGNAVTVSPSSPHLE